MRNRPSAARVLRDLALRAAKTNNVTAALAAFAAGIWWPESYPRRRGWLATFRTMRPADVNGAPIPWYTYPAIDFLEPRVARDWRVFEFGSGNSTLWWAARTASVTACESDRGWWREMGPRCPPNARIVLWEDAATHAAQIAASGEGVKYEVIVIDGAERVACAMIAPAHLAPGGIVVFDNSDRDQYAEGYAALAAAGFRRLDFWGPGAINVYRWCTSIFYRPENVLGL